jgi:TrmH family RNA methyltransferase
MITSTSSSQVKHIVNLQKKSKLRKEEKQFVVEGIKMVSEAPKDRLVKVYVSETFKADNEEFLEKMNYEAVGKDVLEIVSDNVFVRMSDTQTPQGIMAVVKMSDVCIEDMFEKDNYTDSKDDGADKVEDNTADAKKQPLLLILENLQDPGNLGTIVRMAEGAGVTGIIMSSNTVDIYNPKTIRSTMGSLYRVPVIYVDDICKAVDECKEKGVKVYAAHLKGTDNYNQKDYAQPTAFMIGNEGNGLSDRLTQKADELVRIPMQGKVESLNAAIACTILTYEAVRQRL